MEEIRETADKTPEKISVAGQSLPRWFRRKLKTLQTAISIARDSLLTEQDPERRAETERSIKELLRRKDELELGWEHSTLRKHIENRSEVLSEYEKRSVLSSTGTSWDTRASDTSTSRMTAVRIFGYGAVFNSLSQNLGGFFEKILPGAFTEAIRTSTVSCLFNHDANHIFGRNTSSTLELDEDVIGLKYTCHLLKFDPASFALSRRIDRKDVDGCSISFSGVTDRWELKPGSVDIRVIEKIDRLYDTGPVCYPAYLGTSCGAVFEKVFSRTERLRERYGDEFSAEELDGMAELETWQADFDKQWQAKHRPVSDERQRQIKRRLRKAEFDYNYNNYELSQLK